MADRDTNATYPTSNEDLLQGTGSIPLAASSTGPMSLDELELIDEPDAMEAAPAPRYVRQRAAHRDQGSVDDLNDDDIPSASYTHDSNITVGGATPLSGMAYRRSRSNMSRVHNGTRYGQYLEIPKGRRSIFASRERARRRRSVLALFAVIALLAMAALFVWNMMQRL